MKATSIAILVAALFAACTQTLAFTHARHISFMSRVCKSNAGLFMSSTPDWLERPGEEIVEIETDETEFLGFYDADESYDEDSPDFSQESITQLTLNEISEYYSFSLDYLGDFCVQCGAPEPIDVNLKVGDFLAGDDIYNLLQAVSTLDPQDCNIDYDGGSLEELAEDFGVSMQIILDICKRDGHNLPFGKDTVLHSSVIQQIQRRLDNEEAPEKGLFIPRDYIDDEENVWS
jgi:hypothetical protein